MKPSMIVLISIVLMVAGCTSLTSSKTSQTQAKVLEIRWQRLVDEQGQTCERCETTKTAVDNAVRELKRSLEELGIDVLLEKTAISSSEFSEDPLQSNRIWLSGKPIEEWLSAVTGRSPCSAACGSSECRTISVDGETYEAISTELIIKAGLLAAAELAESQPASSCCPTTECP